MWNWEIIAIQYGSMTDNKMMKLNATIVLRLLNEKAEIEKSNKHNRDIANYELFTKHALKYKNIIGLQ